MKLSLRHGDRMVPGATAVAAVRAAPSLVEGAPTAEDAAAAARWVARNRDVPRACWDGAADTAELMQRLVRV